MEKQKQNVGDYNIGLDIGTNSIGWVITDDDRHIKHVRGKNGIGVRLFEAGKSAQERRGFRTTRRRLSRRKWRLRLLREIFDEPISEIDPTFFARLEQSSVSPKDDRKSYDSNIIFDNQKLNDEVFKGEPVDDKKFHDQYHTVYHLRNAMLTEDRQFDLREVYLAMHHIIKYRGHFLSDAKVNKFKGGDLNLDEHIKVLNEQYENKGLNFKINLDEDNRFKDILTNKKKSRSDRQKETLKEDFFAPTQDKELDKRNKKIATEILKAILGMKAAFNVIFNLDVENAKDWKLTLEDEDFDAKIAQLSSEMSDEDQTILEQLNDIYSGITLADILKGRDGKISESLSEAMVKKYKDHKDDLKLLKSLIHTMPDKKKAKNLKDVYAGYVDGEKGKKLNWDDFVKKVSNNLDDSEASKKIQSEIDLKTFMPKQRNKDNGAVPHQLQQQELEKIIENQSKYYPFLKEENPNEARRNVAKYKLSELVAFRVPYYVGPMIEEKTEGDNSKFAWMQRKEQGDITPWNFDEKVNRNETANRFIRRMTTTDTYLIGEDVLPKNSLLYQRFVVLNEINKLKVNGKPITPEEKRYVFDNLMKNKKNVKLKDIANLLVEGSFVSNTPHVSGTTDQINLNNSLGTYNDFKKIFGQNVVDDPDKEDDLEKIVEYSTVFEDNHIYQQKLKEFDWLTDKQRKDLASKRYRGWGRFSRKLLEGIPNSEGERLIDTLWNTNDNLMQAIADKTFKENMQAVNGKKLDKDETKDIINNLYTSPENKKAIRQVMLVVEDIQKAMGGLAPKDIFMEFPREDQNSSDLTKSRSAQLNYLYNHLANDAIDDVKELKGELKNQNKQDFKDRLFLYFTQGGRDMYTGARLHIDDLSSYDIDHIVPQSYLVDNSLNNRVLVSRDANREIKNDQLPFGLFGSKMKPMWQRLLNAGLITKQKYNNLTLTNEKISKYDLGGHFLNRQLVVTRQVIKYVAQILQQQYPDTDIVSIKAAMTHEMRKEFNFFKNRDVNDYHHAFDAYLTSFVGQEALNSKHGELFRQYMVFGAYQNLGGNKKNNEGQEGKFKGMKEFNVLAGLLSKNPGMQDPNKDALIGYARKVYRYKRIPVVKEVTTNHAGMFKQTIYPAPKNASKKKQLVPIKKGKPTKVYGGYTSLQNAYMVLVKQKKKNGDIYKLVGFPTKNLIDINDVKNDREALKEKTKEIIKPNFTNKKGKIEEYEVVDPKIPINQFVNENGQLFTLGSYIYKHNAQQLVLSDRGMKILTGKKQETTVDELKGLFNEICNNVQKHLTMFNKEDFENAREEFFQINDKKKMLNLINRLLKGLHANADFEDLSEIGLGNYFGRFVLTAGLKLSPNSVLIFQSPTGLFSHSIKVKDM